MINYPLLATPQYKEKELFLFDFYYGDNLNQIVEELNKKYFLESKEDIEDLKNKIDYHVYIKRNGGYKQFQMIEKKQKQIQEDIFYERGGPINLLCNLDFYNDFFGLKRFMIKGYYKKSFKFRIKLKSKEHKKYHKWKYNLVKINYFLCFEGFYIKEGIISYLSQVDRKNFGDDFSFDGKTKEEDLNYDYGKKRFRELKQKKINELNKDLEKTIKCLSALFNEISTSDEDEKIYNKYMDDWRNKLIKEFFIKE